jgi:hypothetical protein
VIETMGILFLDISYKLHSFYQHHLSLHCFCMFSGRQLKWYTFAGDFFNTLKAFIGTNYQALPFAFANSGLGVSYKL